MEELRKLEQVQKTLKLMQSHGLIDSSSNNNADDSNRFLANFILLLIQPCGTLDIDRKCQLISDHFPKISAAFLEEALLWLCDEGNNGTENPVPLECEDEAGVGSLQTYSEDMAMVGFDSMQRANSTLEDFGAIRIQIPTTAFIRRKLYLSVKQFLCGSRLSELPLSTITKREEFLEARSHFLDRYNEKLLQLPISGVPDFDGGSALGPSRNWILKFMKIFRTNPFGPLAVLLEHHGLLTERIKEELKCGEEYWSLERKLCRALTGKKEIPVEDVMRAIHLKSFDFRVLNLLLYQLRGEKINEVHMEFLSISEFLVEVSDDLFDYEDDVLENNFNILRMFVGIYGASAAPTMLAKSITEAEEKYDCLLKALDPKLSLNYQKRCEEATKEGGKIFGPPLGTWTIPSVIEDEDLYRYEILNTRPAVLP